MASLYILEMCCIKVLPWGTELVVKNPSDGLETGSSFMPFH